VRVLDPKAVVYSAPRAGSRAVTEVYAGDEMEVGKTVRDGAAAWVEVTLPGGQTGFVSSAIKVLRIRKVALAQPRVEARLGPADEADVKMVFKQGDHFTLAGLTKFSGVQWIEVRDARGQSGYIPGTTKFREIAAEEQPAAAPVPAQPVETQNLASLQPAAPVSALEIPAPAPEPATFSEPLAEPAVEAPPPPPVESYAAATIPLEKPAAIEAAAPQPPAGLPVAAAAEAVLPPAVASTPAARQFQELFKEAGLARIQRVVQLGAVQGAAISLLVWGAINIAGWAFFGEQSRQIVAGITDNPTGDLWLALYASLILGVGLLAFGLAGLLTRAYITVFLDGLSLIAIGIWNIAGDFVAINALRPYGYTLNNVSQLVIILGVFQLIWGFRRLGAFWRFGRWSPQRMRGSEVTDLRRRLQGLVKTPESIESGIINASYTASTLGFLAQTTYYTGALLDDSAVLVSNSLDDCFTFDRAAFKGARLTVSNATDIQIEGKKKTLEIAPVSIMTLKLWCDMPLQTADFTRLGKQGSVAVLKPYLRGGDITLRAAAVSALGALRDPDARRAAMAAMDDPAAPVQAAAFKACRQMKIASFPEKAAVALSSSDPALRIAVASYLAAFPSEVGRAAVERAASVERDPKVKSEVAKAQRALRRLPGG